MLHVVVGADRNGFDLRLRADNVLKRRTELHGEPAVGHENKSDHRDLVIPDSFPVPAFVTGNHAARRRPVPGRAILTNRFRNARGIRQWPLAAFFTLR